MCNLQEKKLVLYVENLSNRQNQININVFKLSTILFLPVSYSRSSSVFWLVAEECFLNIHTDTV